MRQNTRKKGRGQTAEGRGVKKDSSVTGDFVHKAKSQSEAAVKASFVVAEAITKSAQPFTEGELVKWCVIKVWDIMCPDKNM